MRLAKIKMINGFSSSPVLIPKKDLQKHLAKLNSWRIVQNKYLEKEFDFSDFKSAWGFVNKISKIAEALFHHPEIYFTWGKVRVKLYTHSLGGLSGHDFALAKRIDKIK